MKSRLHHEVPPWVPDGSAFHIRIRVARTFATPLTTPELSKALLESVAAYHRANRWFCHLALLMPDHLHGLFSFTPAKPMRDTIGKWKQFHARNTGIEWQLNFFDHRIRNDREFALKVGYIRNNPVAKGLCAGIEDWRHVIDSNAITEVPVPPPAALQRDSNDQTIARRD